MQGQDSKPHKTDLGGQLSSPDKYVPPEKMPLAGESIKETEKIKKDLEEFKKKLLKKFPFSIALGVLPVNSYKMFEEDEGLLPEEIQKKPTHLIFIIPEDNFKDIPKKIKPEIVKLIKESKQNLWIHIKTPVDVWNYGLDSKPEYLDAVGGSFPLHDNGFLGALRVAVVHKTLVLRKFEKYVASYVVGGSLVRGTAEKTSDVDTFIIIDDTDVKRMPRLQLLEKLRGIIYDYIREATALAGVQNVLNVQVYLLTDFWDSVKDANPVMFTFIRDGVPMHDRGTFLPWKLLLQMGKIKPSPEAVDKFMKYGEQNEGLVTRRMLDAFVDIYWGVVTPTQALMMLVGHAPPTPKEISAEVKKVFVEQEKVMGIKEWQFLDKMMKLWKDYEHGRMKKILGGEIDKILEDATNYDKKLKEMRGKLEGKLTEKTAERVENDVFSLLKTIFGNKTKMELIKDFEKKLVKVGKMQKRFVPVLKDVSEVKQKAKSKKFSQAEVDKVSRDASELIRELIDYVQRKEIVATEKGVIQVSYNDRKGELVFTDFGVFFVEGKVIARVGETKFENSDMIEFEKAMKGTKNKIQTKVNSKIFDILKKELGNFSFEI